MLIRPLSLVAACLLTLCLLPFQALGQGASRLPADGVASVEILPGWREGRSYVSALRIRLAPGWKTYWRAPGEAGIPPSITWNGSDNLASVTYVWPTPEVFFTNGQRALGYRDELVLPLILTPQTAGQPIRLQAGLDLGVCHDVCVPVSAAVTAMVTAEGAPDPRIHAALKRRALSGKEAGLRSVSCRVEPIRDGLAVYASLDLPALGKEEVVVIEAGVPGVWASESRTQRKGQMLEARAELVPPQAKPFSLDRSRLRITVISGTRAVEIEGCRGG